MSPRCAKEVVGTVRLGMIGTTGRWLVPQLFDLLRVRHPHIHLNVAEGSSAHLEQQLASGQLDLAVVTFPLSGDEVLAAQLFDEDLVVVLPPGHPLAAEPRSPSSASPNWSCCSRRRAPHCGPRSTAPWGRPVSCCGRPWSSMGCA